MKLTDESLDYEPLRRTPGSKSATADTEDTEFHFKKSAKAKAVADDLDGNGVSAKREKDAQRESAPREEKPELQETWIHKHGHSVSYAGIFLFTALVFFRPYELSPSLMWLSSSAFWVALATVVVFLLTQLGLENTLTARPR